MAELILLPTYMRKWTVMVRIGKTPPEIKLIWLVAAIMTNTKKEVRLVEATSMRQLKWWWYSLELLIQATPSDKEGIIYEVILSEETKFRVIIERCLPI